MRAARTIFPTVQQAQTTSSTMNDSPNMKGHTLQQAPTKLALAELRLVKWVQGQQFLMSVYQAIAQRYAYFRQMIVVSWILLMMEVVSVWWWTFVHNVPWPQVVLDVIYRTDSAAVYIMEVVQRRVDWWWDVASVRLMWFRESLENFFDRNLTTIDHYFGIVQDWMFVIFNFVMKPLRGIGETASSYLSQKTTAAIQNKNGSLRRNSEGYEAEYNDEDYLSDASVDSRRLLKEDSRGEAYMRLHTTANAEGKFREAMYHRVRNELGVMRKNSIRFSKGIVNCARQMVEQHTRRYGESFLQFCQRWAREHGILDLLQTIQEEMRGRPFLVKPLVLVRVLSEAWLAFLLRLVRGKKSRRTRSMRSESLRRRALNPNGTSSPLPLSPAALQQSSEPVQLQKPQHLHLAVQQTLPEAVLKEEEEDLEGFLSKDSALGSEDNRSVTLDSDQTISHIDEDLESDSDLEHHKWNTYSDGGDQKSPRGGDKSQAQEKSSSSSLCTPSSQKPSILSRGGQKSYHSSCSTSQKISSLCTGSLNSSSSSYSSSYASPLSSPSSSSSWQSAISAGGSVASNQKSPENKPKSSKKKRVTIQ